MNKIYGFEGEVKAKYTDTVFQLFSELFQSLPLAYILDGSQASGGKKAFIVHGGLFSRDGVTLDELNAIDRHQEPDSGLMAEMLWSDPQEATGWGPSKRGIGVSFGPDVTHRFLDANGLDLVVRSHEMKDEGYEVAADGRLITIFSAPNYCDQMGNKGAFIIFDHTMEPKFVQFQAVPVCNEVFDLCSECQSAIQRGWRLFANSNMKLTWYFFFSLRCCVSTHDQFITICMKLCKTDSIQMLDLCNIHRTAM